MDDVARFSLLPPSDSSPTQARARTHECAWRSRERGAERKSGRRRTADDGDDALGLLYSELRLNWRRSRGRESSRSRLSSHMSAVDDYAEINAETTYSGSVPEEDVIAGPCCIALS